MSIFNDDYKNNTSSEYVTEQTLLTVYCAMLRMHKMQDHACSTGPLYRLTEMYADIRRVEHLDYKVTYEI